MSTVPRRTTGLLASVVAFTARTVVPLVLRPEIGEIEQRLPRDGGGGVAAAANTLAGTSVHRGKGKDDVDLPANCLCG